MDIIVDSQRRDAIRARIATLETKADNALELVKLLEAAVLRSVPPQAA